MRGREASRRVGQRQMPCLVSFLLSNSLKVFNVVWEIRSELWENRDWNHGRFDPQIRVNQRGTSHSSCSDMNSTSKELTLDEASRSTPTVVRTERDDLTIIGATLHDADFRFVLNSTEKSKLHVDRPSGTHGPICTIRRASRT